MDGVVHRFHSVLLKGAAILDYNLSVIQVPLFHLKFQPKGFRAIMEGARTEREALPIHLTRLSANQEQVCVCVHDEGSLEDTKQSLLTQRVKLWEVSLCNHWPASPAVWLVTHPANGFMDPEPHPNEGGRVWRETGRQDRR